MTVSELIKAYNFELSVKFYKNTHGNILETTDVEMSGARVKSFTYSFPTNTLIITVL